MIRRIVVACVIGFIVFLIFAGIGILLEAAGVSPLVDLGRFLAKWAVWIGVAGGVLSFFAGWDPFTGIRNA